MENAGYITFISNEADMLAFGKKLAKAALSHLNHNRVIFLYGQLGAGKTTLARGFLRELGFSGRVKSPTYTLVEPYELTDCTVFHFDLYRLDHPHELEAMGIQDYFIPKTICLIEWPEQGEELLPSPDIACFIRIEGESREIKIQAQSTEGETILQRLQHEK